MVNAPDPERSKWIECLNAGRLETRNTHGKQINSFADESVRYFIGEMI